MKSLRLSFVALSTLVVVGCSQPGNTPGTGGSSASGGSIGTGGATSTSTGGVTSTGGTTVATTGGVSGTGGDSSVGGSTGPGSGGTTMTTTGGSTATGGATAVGGAMGGRGTGGATATGGAAGGTTATGGAAGGGSADESLAGVAGIKDANGVAFMDSWILFPCYSQQAQDCIAIPATATCPPDTGAWEEQGYVQDQPFKVGGVPGKMYNITIKVNGISEAKYYTGGTRAAGTTDPANANAINGTDTFHTDGAPVQVENYNIYSIRSKKMDGTTEIHHYYLNSFPQTNTPYENHQTFPISFTHDIQAMGGGTLTLHVGDRNCHAIDNCGIGIKTAPCQLTDGRYLPNEMNTVIPTMYMGKPVSGFNLRNGAAQPFHAQAIHITATAVTPM